MEKPDNRTEKRKLGDIGENIACDFLAERDFEILGRNYLRKWGEIDIIARKGNLMRFVEVKSVSRATFEPIESKNRTQVTHATPIQEQISVQGKHLGGGYRPEDNMHPWKLKRLSRAIQTYLLEKNIDSEWQLDLVTVKINMKTRLARVELIENIII